MLNNFWNILKDCYAFTHHYSWLVLIGLVLAWFIFLCFFITFCINWSINGYYKFFWNFRRRNPKGFYLGEGFLKILLFLAFFLIGNFIFFYCLYISIPYWPE